MSGTYRLILQVAVKSMNAIPATRWQQAFQWKYKNYSNRQERVTGILYICRK